MRTMVNNDDGGATRKKKRERERVREWSEDEDIE